MQNTKHGLPETVPASTASNVSVAPEGVSLRDWFAGQALAGYLAAHAGEGIEMPDAAKTGRRAYQFADAMLAARTAPPAPQS